MPWNPNLINSRFLAVHAAFLNYDQILFFGGNQHDPALATAKKTDATCLFDCRTNEVVRIGSPPYDLFCCGHSITADGILMVAGGTFAFDYTVAGLHHEHFPGLRDTAAIRLKPGAVPAQWYLTALMNPGVALPGTQARALTGGRWYPTLVTLPNGDILALSGHPGKDDSAHTNYIPEVFTPTPTPGGSWHRLGSFTDPVQNKLFGDNATTDYPRAHLLPTGDIVITSPTVSRRTVTLTVSRNPWAGQFNDICEFKPDGDQYGGWGATSVLLPLLAEENYKRRRVMVAGGDDSWILDLSNWHPGMPSGNRPNWRSTLHPRVLNPIRRRINGHGVLLPTGEVVFVGGVAGAPPDARELDATAVKTVEIFYPHDETWAAPMAASEQAQVVRNYHSVALLMPDGRVWTAGSDHDKGRGTGPNGAAELRIEIYEPWYHGNPNRPEIKSAPDHWATGSQFEIKTTQAVDIKRVAMVRTGSCTHAFNPDQRYISLAFQHIGGDKLLVTAPPDGNIAPTGMYFLYTINSQGLPSFATTVYVSPDPQSVAERQWKALTGG